MTNYADGIPVKVIKTNLADMLGGPGELIVHKLILAMAQAGKFMDIFGPPADSKGDISLRWAAYSRDDWSVRHLPAINVYESEVETKESENSYLTGTVRLQAFWPPSFRRPELARIPREFTSAIINLFGSAFIDNMLDPHPTVNVATKVPGLNELGRSLNWTPNTEAILENNLVPVTIVDIRYRIDLRRWHMYLENDDRTKGNPFERTLADLVEVSGVYQGITQPDDVQVEVEQNITV